MAMPSGNVAASDKMQFPGAAGAGEINHHHHHLQQQQQRPWFPDERDGFISWLRGEFAAANAIIDSLCHHLRAVGEPGEYDVVIGCIQQRRCNWNGVLHMQQYFSVAEVMFALNQVAWRRQQRGFDSPKSTATAAKDFKRSAASYRHVPRAEPPKEGLDPGVDGNSTAKGDRENEKNGVVKPSAGEEAKFVAVAVSEDNKDGSLKSSENAQGILSNDTEHELENDGCTSKSEESDSHSIQIHNEKQSLSPVAKTFVGTEVYDGKTVNVVDGLKLYESLFNEIEVSRLVSLVNDLRASGKRGQFQGQTYVISKRPMRGHGREMIQLGIPMADAPPEEESSAGTSKDRRVESIPALLQNVIDRLLGMQILSVKPESCIIDCYNEGDHSQPHMCPPWYGRPVCILFLTECDMTFGKIISADHPGDYRGALKLSLVPGSVLMLQGKSVDFARHAIPSLRKQRILVTFTKPQPRRSMPSDGQRLASPTGGHSSHWGPLPSRSPNHIRHPMGPKHYGAVPTTGVLPAPSIRPQIPHPNGIQPLFVTTPLASAVPFPPPVPIPAGTTGWPTAPLQHPPPRIPVPGTGVFLPPPGSGNSSPPQQLTNASEMNLTMETACSQEKENVVGRCNHSSSASLKEKAEGKSQRQECNGSVDGAGNVKAAKEEQQHQDSGVTVANKQL